MEREERLQAWDSAPRPVITPSLLNCDFARVGEELDALKRAGVVAVHLDVMDGHFVPNISYGPPVIAAWRRRTDFAFDAHLMISDPARYADAFIAAGCDSLLFHIEVMPDPTPLLRRIRASGCRAGLVLNPPTPIEAVLPFLAEADSVLVMSVMPGFGGQAFQPEVLAKVETLRQVRPGLPIAMDGGINVATAARAVASGTTQLVVGSATFRPDGNYAAALGEVSEAARRGLQRGGPPSPP
ncbi:MAG: ribulose-phosphate 3-epimerase [Isosphaeraceae bacterium]